MVVAAMPITLQAAESMNDAGYLNAFYCWELTRSPRLVNVLSQEDNSAGEHTYIQYLRKHNLDPTDAELLEGHRKFSTWVLQDMKGDESRVLGWFHTHCTGKE